MTLAEDGKTALLDFRAGKMKRIEHAALLEDGSLGAVNVLASREILLDCARAEGHHAPLLIPDRKHQAISKAVIATARLFRIFSEDSRGEKIGVRKTVAPSPVEGGIPGIRGRPKSKVAGNILWKPPTGEVLRNRGLWMFP